MFLESLFISPSFQMPENSVLLLGAINSFHEKFYAPIIPLLKRYCVHAETQARESLGEAGFEFAFADGQKMPLDDALDLALNVVEQM